MTPTYKITGMTCNGCRTQVENTLNEIDGVKTATVDLKNETAVIEMSRPINTETLQKALPKKYSISIQQPKTKGFVSDLDMRAGSISNNPETEKSKLEQLKPLLLILGYITAATILLNYPRENWNTAMLDFMGLFFIVFSFFKILDLNGFPDSFRMYDPLARVVPTYGWIYPFLETMLGLMFLMRIKVDIALIITLIILGITTFGVTKTLLDKKSIQCACLGTALKLPMTEATFIENAIMIVMAVLMLIV